MAYIHELPAWPDLTWDAHAFTQVLAALHQKQGKYLGKMEAMGFELRTEASVVALTSEVVKSSAIEGERLDTAEVRSSIALKLGLNASGLPTPGRQVEGIVEMMLDATQNYDLSLTEERLFGWHAALFPTGRNGMHPITVGAWRDDVRGPMQVVSGPVSKERVHFQAPTAAQLEVEMGKFLEWFNGPCEIDPVLRAAVAHLWFVTIHPFDDGNGRIARAVADMALSRADGSKERFYSMSTGIEAERKEYYIQLESAQRGSLDITSWLAWFLGCLDRAIDAADTMLASVLLKAKLWQKINIKPVNDRQRKVINRMLEHDWEGNLKSSKYARLAKCSPDTALRDIKELLERGVLTKTASGGRSTSYQLVNPDEL
ncbi:MAG: Fic family protein [Phycisphaerales bacterium]|jgi:Fic family protein|nr:Fic family protein [Phycisphaerales bacterium]